MPNCENYRKLTSDKDDYTSSPNDAYDEGYSEGYEQGRYDGSHGYSHGYVYGDSCSYYDYYENMLDRAAVLQP